MGGSYSGRALCDVEECGEIARFIRTGDGRAKRDPLKRCAGHQADTGLWRDLATVIGRDVHSELPGANYE